jgi:hypothetical protein
MARTDVIVTPDQRVRVFISSTLEELAAERAAARRAISRLYLAPVWCEPGARPHPPRRMYRAFQQARAWLGGLTGAEFTAFAAGSPAQREVARTQPAVAARCPSGRRCAAPSAWAPRVLTGTGGSSGRSAGRLRQREAI